MAITTVASFDKVIPLPAGYTKPTLPTLNTPVTNTYDVDLLEAGIVNADPAVGAAAFLAALEADFETNYAPGELGLNAALTIAVNLTVKRLYSSMERSSLFATGTPTMKVSVYVEYEITP